jgi:hypothetical protein
VFAYIEFIYNPTRRDNTIGHLSPAQLKQAQEPYGGVNRSPAAARQVLGCPEYLMLAGTSTQAACASPAESDQL